ncbi:MAG: hypothetical protein U5K69_13720 [Balneolaceae bacterium]|nr:hypothetical protein [Balneolaceae bacterium]
MVNVAINGNGEVIREAKLPTSRQSLEDFRHLRRSRSGRRRMHQQLVLAVGLVSSS